MTDWTKYYKMIRKKIWIVILTITIFVSVASYISLFKLVPQYEAGTQLIVLLSGSEGNRITYEELLAGQLLVKNYKELIISRAVTTEVIQKVHLSGMTEAEFADRIDVELLPDSSMMRILVRNEDREFAARIANEVATVFIQKASQLLNINNIILVDKAIVSEKPVYPRPTLVIGFSFLMGIFLSLGLILVLTYRDDTLGNANEVELKTGLPVVGIIPDMKIR